MGKDPGSSYCHVHGLSSILTAIDVVVVAVVGRRYLEFGQSYSSSLLTWSRAMERKLEHPIVSSEMPAFSFHVQLKKKTA